MSQRQSRCRRAVGPLGLQVQSTMTHFPTPTTFSALCKTHDLIPVYRRLYSDTMTPVTAFHRLDEGGSACLFESVDRRRECRPLQFSRRRARTWKCWPAGRA